MAEQSNANSTTSSQPVQQLVNGQLYTWQPVQNPTGIATNTNSIQSIPSKQEREPDTGQKPGAEQGDNAGFVKPQNKEEEKESTLSIDDLKTENSELKKTLKDMDTRFKTLEEDNVIRKQNEKRYQMAAKVAKYSQYFKSKDSFEKEVDNAVRFATAMTEEELEDYLERKYATMEIKPRSAAVINNNPLHEVPNVQAQANNASSVSSDNNRKFIEVMDMLDSKGGV